LRRVQARAALVTVPLGVLQARRGARGAIAFSPPLAAKRAALATLAMGSVVRVTVLLRDRFWATEASARRLGDPGLDRLSFLHGSDPHFPVWWTAYPVDAPVLVGWSGGRRARELAARGDDAFERAAISALARQFHLGRARAKLVERLFTHDWEHDPFARGAYSYPAVGGVRASARLARPLEGTLFFAGEATAADGGAATVHGALASGERAAAQILRALARRRRRARV
jgi:monoamine oxidase